MGKLQTFAIELDNPSMVYFGGQTVNGRVLVVLTEPMKMTGIRLNLCGIAFCYWTDSHNKHSDTYTDWEYYFNTDVLLWGKAHGSSGETPVMQAGSYQLPFSFTLPPNCPSSFEGKSGYVRYFCKATIDKSWKFDHTTKRPFTLVSLVDLNSFTNITVPMTDERTKNLGCCASGGIICTITVPRSGYVPGEILPIDMQVVNNSGSKINDVKVSIVEHVEYYARGRILLTDRIVGQVKKGHVEARNTLLWKGEGMRIPPMAPTLLNCRIMKITYFIYFTVSPSGIHSDLELRVPIKIGNVPLRTVMQELNNLYQRSNSVNPTAPPLPLTEGTYPDLPPPSYQDAVFGATSIRDAHDNDYTMGQMTFAPRYPYYDWPQMSTVGVPTPAQPAINSHKF